LNNISNNPTQNNLHPDLFKVNQTQNIQINDEKTSKLLKHQNGECNDEKHLNIQGINNEKLVLCDKITFSENEQILKFPKIINEKLENNEENKITEDVNNFLNSDLENVKKKEEMLNKINVCCKECKCFLFERNVDPSKCCSSKEGKGIIHLLKL
jgi:hypothetical protein